jgi:hypothetical protein
MICQHLFWVIDPQDRVWWQIAMNEPRDSEMWATLAREVYSIVIYQSTHAMLHKHTTALSALERSDW